MKKAVRKALNSLSQTRKINLVRFAPLVDAAKPGTDVSLLNAMMHVLLKIISLTEYLFS